MILKNTYWYFKSALSHKFCDDIISFAKEKEKKIALTGNLDENISKKDLKKLFKKRNSKVVWLNDQWIYKEIHPYIQTANINAEWNFDWNYSENCQFTIYKKGQFYDWHKDGFNNPFNNPNDINFHGKIRKLSCTVSLSDEKEYSGGELEFKIQDDNAKKSSIIKCKEILPKGSLVVFPSFVPHRVCPVKKGTRYSLVLWNLGYPFK
jgi:PKHD-type hydroxylase